MSQINANIVVEPYDITIQQVDPGLTVTPNVTTLNVVTGGFAVPGGINGALQYNNAQVFDGVPNVTYLSGNLSLGNVSNVKITGGTIAYYLQTDGAGNLTWAPGTGNVTGNATSAGSNNAIQLSDGAGNFKAGSGFNFDPASNIFGAPGNINVGGNAAITGNVTAGNSVSANYLSGVLVTAAQPNITSVGTLTSLGVNGNIVAANIIANTGSFIGNGSGLTNLPAANISGQVANALIAGTVYTNSQPNITSVGNLINCTIDGTISIHEGFENVAIIGAQTGTYNYDLLDGAIQYSNVAIGSNLVLNFRGNSTTTANVMIPNSKSITSTYILTTGSNAVGITGIQIDGSNVNVNWASNVFPTFYTNALQSYTFTIIKTNTTPSYLVLGSSTRY